MSLLKATVQYARRTRWKLALSVFLMGVGLAAVSRSMEVNPFLTDMQEFMEANAPDESASPEEQGAFVQVMALMVVGRFLRFAFYMGATLFGLLVVGSLVAGERASGAVMLWGQQRGSLPAFYVKRYVALQVVNLAVQLVFGVTVAVAALAPGGNAPTALAAFVQPALLGLMGAAVSFAASALGIRRNAFAGLGYIFLSVVIGETLGPASPLATGFWEHVAAVLPYLTFPMDAVTRFAEGIRSDWDWEATWLLFYHFALWSALGWFGLRRVARRPLRL